MSAEAVDRQDLLAGRYLLGDVIGRGGMGVVLRAWDNHLDRYVAVKLLSRLAMDPISRARFSAEGKTLAALNHPGLITLFDAATEGTDPYLVMELVDGQPLNERCNGTRMDVAEVVAIGARLADALSYVHSRNIVHRDIKPSNVLLADDGGVKLADFGIARLVDGVSRHTDSGITMGTAAYVSPEQVRDEPVTVAGDIYSLGLVLLEALAGGPVFSGPANTVVLARLKSAPAVDDRLPADLRHLLRAMTAMHPDHRPSADQVAAQLRDILRSGVTVAVPEQAPAPAAVRPTGSRRGFRSKAGQPPRTEVITTPRARPAPMPVDQGRRPLRTALVGAVAVTVVVGALLLALSKSYNTDTASQAGPVTDGQGPREAAPSPVTIVPKELSDRADDAVEQGRQAAEKAGQSLVDKAQEQLQEAERSAREAIERAAKNLADEAADRAGAALDDAWQAIQDAVTGGDS